MGSFTVLRDVSDTLKKLIKDNISELPDENAIVFDSPADIDTAPTTNKLSIFLYQIVENSFLRNDQPAPVGIDKLKHPPLTLDLFYLFTPYAQYRETEMIMLEKLMMIFYENRVLKSSILQGKLKENGNEEIRTVSHSFSFEEINKLWERFPNKPFKLSLAYMLTPVKVPSDKVDSITRVKERILDLSQLGE